MAEAVVGGVRIHYELAGEGPPVVVTAGQGTGAEARAAWLAGLARHHLVLSYDQRGTGRSERTGQGQSMRELADDIVALMDHAGMERAHVIGVSTGTGKATALAAQHPGRVDRLVLAAPWTHGDAPLHTPDLTRILVQGAREHNLQNVDVDLPRDSMIVFTGLSGSGKSSLAFDTIFAEGQRRYVESLSAYARQFLGQVDKPDVDFIEGLSPAVSIDQKSTSKNPRSTVGTITEIYDRSEEHMSELQSQRNSS
jgi:pimeloyl-ACP methyl ester carboxylesterase